MIWLAHQIDNSFHRFDFKKGSLVKVNRTALPCVRVWYISPPIIEELELQLPGSLFPTDGSFAAGFAGNIYV